MLVSLALLVTLLNAVKPLHIDDTYYYFHARQAGLHPFDPHGFLVFWHEKPEPASNRVAPPVLPFWLAGFVRAFPDAPFVWKLSLLPFVLGLVFALRGLLRRFASGLELPLLVMTVASPALLPSLNLMPDVPALALASLAVVAFVRASEALDDGRYSARRRRAAAFLWASGAGLLAGLAAETKYTGLVAPAVLLAHALVHRRLRLFVISAGAAGAVFAGWELFTALQYGQSHFLRHLGPRAEPLLSKLPLLALLCSVLGAVSPGLCALGLLARDAPRRVAALAGTVLLTAYLLAPVLPGDEQAADEPNVAQAALFSIVGAFVLVGLGWSAQRLLRRSSEPELRGAAFLVAWLGIECVGFVALSPFPAVRRILGLVVPATLLLGRACLRSCANPERRRLVWGAALLSGAFGLYYWSVDLAEARAARRAVEQTAAWLASQPGTRPGRVFFAGHWGFQYYAERAGMLPAVSGAYSSGTPLRAGDVLVVPSARYDQQQVRIDPARTRVVHRLSVDDWLPSATLPGFYAGGVPLARLSERKRLEVTVYRVLADTFP